MTQQIQRDPLAVVTGGLAGLAGLTFSPIPATEGDVAARQHATVPQFGLMPAQVITTPTFKPTTQAELPTGLLVRPETVGQHAFRPIQQEVVFPALTSALGLAVPTEMVPTKPAETIEEVEQRLTTLVSPYARTRAIAGRSPTRGLGSGSITEPPLPSYDYPLSSYDYPPPPPLPPYMRTPGWELHEEDKYDLSGPSGKENGRRQIATQPYVVGIKMPQGTLFGNTQLLRLLNALTPTSNVITTNTYAPTNANVLGIR